MKRFIWGIILVVLAIVQVGETEEEKEEVMGMSMTMLVGGGILIYFGNRHKNRVRLTSEFSLQMLRDDGKINTEVLAQKIGVLEIDIKRIYC